MKNSRLLETIVGPFYVIGGEVFADGVKTRDGEEYGNFINYGSHWDFWSTIQKENPILAYIEYDEYPRGRVVFDKEKNKYIIYLDKKLNKSTIIKKVASEYGLAAGSYIVNDEDEHYTSYNESKVILKNKKKLFDRLKEEKEPTIIKIGEEKRTGDVFLVYNDDQEEFYRITILDIYFQVDLKEAHVYIDYKGVGQTSGRKFTTTTQDIKDFYRMIES